MNVKLLRKIQRTILKRYQQVDMSWWLTPAVSKSNCGTAACIAGWTVTVCNQSDKKLPKPLTEYRRFRGREHNTESEAASLLELEYWERRRLFLQSYWPRKYERRLENAESYSKAYARVVSDRIDHFIKTKGKE